MDFTLLTLEVFELRQQKSSITLEGKEATFMEWIQWSTQYDDPMVKALKALDVGELHSDEWMCTEGVVLYCHDPQHVPELAGLISHDPGPDV